MTKNIEFNPAPKLHYPWPDMDVGDSVTIADQPNASQSRSVAAAREWGNRREPRIKFASRKTPDGGVRIWRIA